MRAENSFPDIVFDGTNMLELLLKMTPISLDHRKAESIQRTTTALRLSFLSPWRLTHAAIHLLTDKLAFRSWAVIRLLAVKFALSRGTDRCTDGLWGNTIHTTPGRSTNGHAFRAVAFLTYILWTTDCAVGLFAFDFTISTWPILALNLALRRSTHWTTNCRAIRIVALPTTTRMTLISCFRFRHWRNCIQLGIASFLQRSGGFNKCTAGHVNRWGHREASECCLRQIWAIHIDKLIFGPAQRDSC